MFSHRIDEDVELRPYLLSDAEEVFRVTDQNRAHIATWLTWIDKTVAVDDTRLFIRHSLDQLALSGAVTCGIWYRGAFVGGVGYNEILAHNNYADIGYWLASDVQGRGIMTRSVRALVGFGFDVLKLNRIEIRCAAGNSKSRAVAERVGCREEGVLKSMHKIRDEYHDMVIYGLLASEWKSFPK